MIVVIIVSLLAAFALTTNAFQHSYGGRKAMRAVPKTVQTRQASIFIRQASMPDEATEKQR
jgi:hypothetical protein